MSAMGVVGPIVGIQHLPLWGLVVVAAYFVGLLIFVCRTDKRDKRPR